MFSYIENLTLTTGYMSLKNEYLEKQGMRLNRNQVDLKKTQASEMDSLDADSHDDEVEVPLTNPIVKRDEEISKLKKELAVIRRRSKRKKIYRKSLLRKIICQKY